MSKPIVESNLRGKLMEHFVWQGCGEEGFEEQALKITEYEGMLEIRQGKEVINLNRETIPALIKILREAKKRNEQ